LSEFESKAPTVYYRYINQLDVSDDWEKADGTRQKRLAGG